MNQFLFKNYKTQLSYLISELTQHNTIILLPEVVGLALGLRPLPRQVAPLALERLHPLAERLDLLPESGLLAVGGVERVALLRQARVTILYVSLPALLTYYNEFHTTS